MLKINGNQIKLIVTDVDGTLITDEQELPTLVQKINYLHCKQRELLYQLHND